MIIYTRHSLTRLRERKIPKPKFKNLYQVNANEKGIIKKSCEKTGLKSKMFIYMTDRANYMYIIFYVFKQTDINKFLLITAFKHIRPCKVHGIKNCYPTRFTK